MPGVTPAARSGWRNLTNVWVLQYIERQKMYILVASIWSNSKNIYSQIYWKTHMLVRLSGPGGGGGGGEMWPICGSSNILETKKTLHCYWTHRCDPIHTILFESTKAQHSYKCDHFTPPPATNILNILANILYWSTLMWPQYIRYCLRAPMHNSLTIDTTVVKGRCTIKQGTARVKNRYFLSRMKIGHFFVCTNSAS